jgi:hypothetical protein
LAVDARHLYWSDAAGSTITEADLHDGSTQPLVTLDQVAQPTELAVDASHIYWADDVLGTINEANLSDGIALPALVSGQSGPFGVAVDASHIYWSDFGDGTINEANLDGSAPHPLVSDQPEPRGVAVGG